MSGSSITGSSLSVVGSIVTIWIFLLNSRSSVSTIRGISGLIGVSVSVAISFLVIKPMDSATARCIFLWLLSWLFYLKEASHCPHLYGISPVCMNMCSLRFCFELNRLSHTRHMKLPVKVFGQCLICVMSYSLLSNTLGQSRFGQLSLFSILLKLIFTPFIRFR